MGEDEPDGRSARADEQRIDRSPADFLRLLVAVGVALVLSLVEAVFGDTLVGFASDLLRGLDALPGWLIDVVVVGTRILGVVMIGGGLVWAIVGRRWRLLVTVGLAALVAELLVASEEALIDHDEGQRLVDVGVGLGPLSSDGFATVWGIAGVAAALTAAAPWLSRGWRRAGWALLFGMMVTDVLNSPVSFAWLGAAVIGWVAGAAVLVALGAPSRRPTSRAVVDGLAGVGLRLRQLDRAGVDARGSTPYFGVAEDGGELFVKALGDDERSADLMFRLYRRIQPRDLGDEQPFSTLRRAVEHEALVALGGAGPPGQDAPLPRLRHRRAERLRAGLRQDRGARRSTVSTRSEVTDDVLAAIWRLLAQLRERRFAHRDLRLANIFVDDGGEVWLIDFGFAEMAASDLLLATDVAELLASSSLYVGADRAVAQAVSSVDRATLSRALRRLRPWALAGATRTALKSRPGFLEELRSRLAAAVGE